MQTEFAEETEGEELGQAEVRGNSPLSKKAAKGKRLTISNMKMVQSKLKGESEVMVGDSLFSLSMSNKVESDLLKNLEKELATYKRRLDERDTHISKVEKKNQELFDELIRAKRTSKEQQSKQEQKILGLERKEEEIKKKQVEEKNLLQSISSVNEQNEKLKAELVSAKAESQQLKVEEGRFKLAVEALKKEVEKLENREKQSQWFIMNKQLEQSLTESNQNLLTLNKKVHALEMEKEAMGKEHKKKLKKAAEAEEERREELQGELDKKKQKVKQLKAKLGAKEGKGELSEREAEVSTFTDRRRMVSEQMDLEDRMTRK